LFVSQAQATVAAAVGSVSNSVLPALPPLTGVRQAPLWLGFEFAGYPIYIGKNSPREWFKTDRVPVAMSK
jgi:hypothetical protein